MNIRWGYLLVAGWIVVASTGASTAVIPSHAAVSERVRVERPQIDRPVRPAVAHQSLVSSPQSSDLPQKAFVDKYCTTCHNQRTKAGGLLLDTMDLADVGAHAREWEKVVVKLRAGLMPPSGMPRPEPAVIDAFTSSLETLLDRVTDAHPNPGRTEPFHRLNRAEYRNAIRDLLSLDVDVTTLLPHDEVSYGFDNIAGVLKLSPLLAERYLAAAQKVSRLALGAPGPADGLVLRIPDQLDQDVRLEGMPVGTRGGAQVNFFASRAGDFVIKAQLSRGLDYDIPHFLGEQVLEFSVDGQRVKLFTLDNEADELNPERQIFKAPEFSKPRGRRVQSDQDDTAGGRIDKRGDDWVVTVPLTAGTHEIRATFLFKTDAVSEGFRKPFLKPYIGRGLDDARETREGASLRTLEIMGPLNPGGAAESVSHRRVFTCHPEKASEELGCAQAILSTLARRAYRRLVSAEDVQVLMRFYADGRASGDFESGVELAVQRILVSPSFLFRTEFAPVPSAVASAAAPASAVDTYRISDVELASRLSFFLWSSIPDDELLDLATQGKLRQPDVLEKQTERMLKDPRSSAFIDNFAGQWLSLRRLPDIVPDPFLFPDYGDTLAQAFEKEAELFFDAIVREDRPALELLTANYTFVNERLARHYDIPNVKGINFQRVILPDGSPRRGLLGKGAILTVTAFPNRTSPVVRGKWVLENLLGAPPPEPPPNVPGLMENGDKVTGVLTMRQRLEQHRANSVCASCHKLMDPLGFALEKFDAIGKYREFDENYEPIDSTGVYPDGTKIDGPEGLRQVLVNHSTQFLTNLTNKMLTYALGRGVEYYDAPAVRGILRAAARNDNRFSSLIFGIVNSVPFQMRRIDS